MDSLYREQILDHSKHPRNQGTLDPADYSYQDVNPLCGDEIRIDVRVEGDRVSDIKFSGRGCAISQAAASMLTELALGQPVAAVKEISTDELLAELGVSLGSARRECALLSLTVLKAGLAGEPLDRSRR